jgi:hypothetical protein
VPWELKKFHIFERYYHPGILAWIGGFTIFSLDLSLIGFKKAFIVLMGIASFMDPIDKDPLNHDFF